MSAKHSIITFSDQNNVGCHFSRDHTERWRVSLWIRSTSVTNLCFKAHIQSMKLI